MGFGDKIAELRKKHNMTQYDLGQAMNVSYQAVSKWEREESQPDFETISKIAKLFNVPLSYFEEGGTVRQPYPHYSEIAAAKMLAGTCTECGKVVYEGEEGELQPKLLCRACHAKKEEERRIEREQNERNRRKSEEDAREMERIERKWHRRGFFWGAVAAVAVLIIGAAVFLTDKPFFEENLIGCLAASFLLPVLAYAVVNRLIWFFGNANCAFDDDGPKYKIAPSMITGACFAAPILL